MVLPSLRSARSRRRSRSRRSAASSPYLWAPVVAVVVTVVLTAAARLVMVLVGQRRRGEAVGEGGTAYAPDPLTGDAGRVEAVDVAPV
jgi:hypothetical protein